MKIEIKNKDGKEIEQEDFNGIKSILWEYGFTTEKGDD